MNEFDYSKQLEALDDDYAQAEVKEGGGSLPEGKYHAILKEAKIVPRQSGGIALSVSFIVTDGACKGRYAFTSYGLSKTGLPYLKGFLRTLNIKLTKLSALEKALPMFPGHRVAISVVKQKDNPQYTNTYVDRYLGMGNLEDYLGTQADAAEDTFRETKEETPFDDDGDLPF